MQSVGRVGAKLLSKKATETYVCAKSCCKGGTTLMQGRHTHPQNNWPRPYDHLAAGLRKILGDGPAVSAAAEEGVS